MLWPKRASLTFTCARWARPKLDAKPRQGKTALMREIYDAQLATPEAQLAFEQLRAAATELPSALLCFERDAATCHRTALAERLHAQDGIAIVHI